MTAYALARGAFPSIHRSAVTNPVHKTVAVRIRARRHALGLSQSGLAEQAGVSPELVSRIERGRCLPSLPTLVTFSNVLRSTPNDLLGFEQPLAEEELRPLLDAVNALGPAQRAEIRRIAEALAKYQSDSPPRRGSERPARRPSERPAERWPTERPTERRASERPDRRSEGPARATEPKNDRRPRRASGTVASPVATRRTRETG